MSEQDKKEEPLEENVSQEAQAEPTEDISLQLKKELDEEKNKYLYLKAEFENYKKNMIKERSEWIKYGSEPIFVELLEIVDNFDRALDIEVTPETLQSFSKGMNLISKEIKAFLKKFNVNEVDSLGKEFDPSFHEALGSEESPETDPGHILRVYKKPYKLYDKVIRHGQVIVAKEPSSEK